MASTIRIVMMAAAVSVARVASAQPAVPPTAPPANPPTDTPPPSVADVTLRAVKDHNVTAATSQGTVVTGKLLAFEPDSVTLALADGTLVTLARAQIVSLRLTERPTTPTVITAPPLATPSEAIETRTEGEPAETQKPRYFGVHLGMAPGVALDVDYSYFHAFISTSFLFPLVTSGQVFTAFTAGAGATFPLNEHWRFDVFGHVAPMFWQQYVYSQYSSGPQLAPYVAVGLGMGFHYTASSGWCIGVKLPVIGATAIGNRPYSSTTGVGESVGFYYLASAMSLPVFSFGYRF
jgi:hypothetical protein